MHDAKSNNLLLIGAQKAGTTSLFEYLRLHPDIACSIEKEVNFFTNSVNKETIGLIEMRQNESKSYIIYETKHLFLLS